MRQMAAKAFHSALTLALQEKHNPWSCISTDIPPLDQLLDGGLRTGMVHLAYGTGWKSRSFIHLLLARTLASFLASASGSGAEALIINGGMGTASLQRLLSSFPLPAGLLAHLRLVTPATPADLPLLLKSAMLLASRIETPLILVSLPSKMDSSFQESEAAYLLKRLAIITKAALLAVQDSPPWSRGASTTRTTYRTKQRALPPAILSLHVIIRHEHKGGMDVLTLEKHPSLPYRRVALSLREGISPP